jgi:hypothetical protein
MDMSHVKGVQKIRIEFLVLDLSQDRSENYKVQQAQRCGCLVVWIQWWNCG